MSSLIPPSLLSWRERQRARQEHERLEVSASHDEQEDVEGDEEAPASPSVGLDETTTLTGTRRQTRRRSGRVTESSGDPGDNNGGNSNTGVSVPNGDVNNGDAAAADVSDESRVSDSSEEAATPSGRPTLAQLQAERVRMQQRANLCVMSAVFLLFFLWVQAIGSSDFGLLLVCLIGTNWTARFMRHQRERDDEFERFLATYDENAPTTENGESGASIYGHDIQTLSFQAQVALAIMESQRQMMEGGYGHPDGVSGGHGVSDAAKERWTKFEYKPEEHEDKDVLKKPADEDLPHCSICLAEYEEGESCVQLPCQHVYHQDCVDSWTANHTRCPLCNLDLMAGDSA